VVSGHLTPACCGHSWANDGGLRNCCEFRTPRTIVVQRRRHPLRELLLLGGCCSSSTCWQATPPLLHRRRGLRLGMGVKVILKPPCIFCIRNR
jgi:hypothetical protein